jgi:hypothetical protein
MTIKHLYPTQRPSLDLNFARTKRLDPRVDFERFSVGTYVGNDGLIKTAVDHEPRFDHDPVTGESLGLLVEEERTNYALYSESPSNWSVTASNGEALPTITANFLDPSGQMNAGRFQGVRAGTGLVRVVFPTSATLPNPYDVIYSVWLKSNTGANQTIKLYIATASTIVEVTPEWKRFNCPVRTGSSTSEFIALQMDNFTSQNCDILVWAPQLEVGTFRTSYIPTTSSTVTRAADVTSITGNNFSSWYNQDEGTIFTKAKMSFALSQSGNFPDVYTSGSFPDRLWAFYFNNGVNRLTVGADTHSRNLETFTSSPQSFKVAQALSNTSLTYSASKDGGNVLTGSLSKAITNTSSISISNSADGAVKHIARLTYYPVRLSDTILQNLTL